MMDRMVERLIEIQLWQPMFFAEIAVRREYILMSDAMSGVEPGKNTIPIFRASHQPDHEKHNFALDGGELHRDVAVFVDPNDE